MLGTALAPPGTPPGRIGVSPVKWRYMATDLIKGRVLADSLPINVQSFGAQLSNTGSLTGSLNLQQNYSKNRPYIEAVEATRSVLWVLMNKYPVWAGVIWDWPDMTRNNGGPLSISAQTIDSVFAHRIISDTLEYPQVDMFTVFADLITYGMTKNSDHISLSTQPASLRNPTMLQWMASNGGVAYLKLPTGTSGVPWTASYTWSDQTQVSSAWSDMTQAGNFDYAFVPGLDEQGNLAIYVRLGYTTLGRPYQQAGYSLVYGPGGNVLDYGYQRTGSQGANFVWATAAPNGSAEQWESEWPHGVDLAMLEAGYPVMETTVSWNGSTVTEQSQVDAFADGQLPLLSQAMTTPTINVGGAGAPALTDIILGDVAPFNASSPLHPPRGGGKQPGLQAQARVTGWTYYPPGPQQSEYLQLNTKIVSAN